MKLLVFSDSHGRLEPLCPVIRMHSDTVDAIIHLGDGAAEVLTLRAAFPDLPFYAVLGNCDSFTYTAFDIRQDMLLTFSGKTLYLCHGDRFGVGGGHGALAAYAQAKGADIVLYGHTHKACEEYRPAGDAPGDKPLWILSPGSISLPRDRTEPSFGILDIGEQGVLFSVGRYRSTGKEPD